MQISNKPCLIAQLPILVHSMLCVWVPSLRQQMQQQQAACRPCFLQRAAGMTSCLQQRSARPRSQLALMCFLPAGSVLTVKLQPLRGTTSIPRHHLRRLASAFFIHLLSPF